MFSDVFLTGTVQKLYDPAEDGSTFAKVRVNKTIITSNGPVTSYANVLMRLRKGYEQYVGKVNPNDIVFARGYLDVGEKGNPPFNVQTKKPVIVLNPWNVRILGTATEELGNDDIGVVLLGHLGKEPEMRYLEDGSTAMTKFSLATSRGFTDVAGERVKETTWWNITYWRRLAETINAFAHVGSRLLVVGTLDFDPATHTLRTWERTDGGGIASSFQVTGQTFTLADSKGENKNGFHQNGIIPSDEIGRASCRERV